MEVQSGPHGSHCDPANPDVCVGQLVIHNSMFGKIECVVVGDCPRSKYTVVRPVDGGPVDIMLTLNVSAFKPKHMATRKAVLSTNQIQRITNVTLKDLLVRSTSCICDCSCILLSIVLVKLAAALLGCCQSH